MQKLNVTEAEAYLKREKENPIWHSHVLYTSNKYS